MRLCEASLFHMNPELCSSSTTDEKSEETFADREKKLQETFGGKRGRSIARKIKDKVNRNLFL